MFADNNEQVPTYWYNTEKLLLGNFFISIFEVVYKRFTIQPIMAAQRMKFSIKNFFSKCDQTAGNSGVILYPASI